MSEKVGIVSIWEEHYRLGIVIGRLKFFGMWFNSRAWGNYPRMGISCNPAGSRITCPSVKSLTLGVLPKSPKDTFVSDVRDELEEFFSQYSDRIDASAERASAMKSLAKNIEIRYVRYLNRIRQPWEDAINHIESIEPTAADDLRTAVDCYIMGQYKPCVAMTRRALERILTTAGSVGNYLIDKIDDAEKKKIILKKD